MEIAACGSHGKKVPDQLSSRVDSRNRKIRKECESDAERKELKTMAVLEGHQRIGEACGLKARKTRKWLSRADVNYYDICRSSTLKSFSTCDIGSYCENTECGTQTDLQSP